MSSSPSLLQLERLKCLKNYFHSAIATASYIKLGLLSFSLTFVWWFNFAPFATTIGKELHLAPEQIKTLGICNLALTIPARLIIGMLLDRFDPRITYSILLIFAAVPCLATVLAQDFNQLVISRLLMGIVGSGFVVGVRMVAEWFQPKEMGIAQGIYGGWGNFGAFGAEFALPMIAVSTSFFAAASNWRLAIAVTMFAAYFAQAGCGATYSIVPLIKKEATGQIAGNVGAYGNFGGVVYLTIFSFTDASTLFSTMGLTALVCAFMCAFFLKEPKDSFAAAYKGELPEITTKNPTFLTEE